MIKNITVDEMYEEWTYFLSRINFKDSFLDGRAIQFMNDFKGQLESLNGPQWKPIDTAPKDGTWIRVWREPAKFGRASCEKIVTWHKFNDEEEGSWRWPCGSSHDLHTPKGQGIALYEIAVKEDYFEDPTFTHWMPLFDAPKEVQDE